MTIIERIFTKIKKVQDISLKWKLLIPFLFFAFAGTTTLATIGLTSQQNLIKKEERKEITHYYHHFLSRLDQKKNQAVSMASIVAENPEVQRLLSERNKEGLLELLMPTYMSLKRDFEISQFHFHLPGAISFLRFHQPEQAGEPMESFRKTIVDAMNTGKAVAGLEKGITGLGIRGVAPVKWQGRIVGSFEIGHTFGGPFLHNFYKEWGIDIALYEIHENGGYQRIAWAGNIPEEAFAGPSQARGELEDAVIRIAPEKFPDRSILLGPIKDYSGRVIAAVEINLDRSEIVARLTQTRNLMVSAGLAGIVVSFLLTYLVAILFIRPIKEIVKEAQDIALEKRESRLEERPNDEMGTLTNALNTMLEALLDRRMEVENYARTLEHRVRDRTSDLLASEEKYRTLVENVPLIVYRVYRDGRTAFVNSYLTERLGYTIEEAVGDKDFWRKNICGSHLADKDVFQTCFLNGEECRAERLVKDKEGKLLTFIDHAIPNKTGRGEAEWIDGIMMDITESKRWQERALRTEEIKTLGEISARIAHEIRNPLSAAGGFARRLYNALAASDPHKKWSNIIVDEIAKLETILQVLLASIRPFDLELTEVDLNMALEEWLKGMEGQLRVKRVQVVKAFSPGIPRIQADEERLSQAFKSILKHAALSVPESGAIFLSTRHENDLLIINVKHKVDRLTDDDLEKFFFPHIEDRTETTVEDLPLSKIIIHRHGGKVEVRRENENVLVMDIEFPVKLADEFSFYNT